MPSIGQTLAGRYRLDARIGSGAFATVFRARDLRLGRDVALKSLGADHLTDPVVAERFDREARVLAAIDHPNVVAIHDVEPADPATDTAPFLVMDLCDGGSLADRLARSTSSALPAEELVPILVDVSAGLEAIHSRGIVHRDLKPSNILLADGRARIADLGIAADGTSDLTDTGTMVGTLAYLAPEQLAGEPASSASDVHALGVVAYLGLTGRLPRPSASIAEIVAASGRPVEPVSMVEPALGHEFDAVVAQALDGDPSRRPAARDLAAAFGVALQRWRTAPGPRAGDDATTLTSMPTFPGAASSVDPTSDRTGRMVVAIGLLAVAALALGSGLYLLAGSGGPVDRPSPSPSFHAVASSPSPSASVFPSPTPTLVATVAPTPTIDPFADASAASRAMRAAIASSRGKGGLKGRESKDLESTLDTVDRAIRARDAAATRDAADQLAGQVAALIDRKAVDASTGGELRKAADDLAAAAQALPG